jgi:hypothetical protein
MRRHCLPFFLASSLLAIAGACDGNGLLTPQMFTATVSNTAVNCNCNLTFDYSTCTGGTCYYHLPIELCLPPELNTATIDYGHAPSAAGMALAQLPQAEFEQQVQEYCEQTVTNIIYHVIPVFNGNWCNYKAPFAPMGGIGTSVSCFPLPLTSGSDSATENAGGNCLQPCDQVACEYDTNCGQGVEDSFGNIDLDKCQCNQVVDRSCPGDPPDLLPTAVFCRP